MPTRNVHVQSGTTNFGQTKATAEDLIYDSADGFLKYDDQGSERTIVNEEETQTITGDKTFSGSTTLSGAVTISGALTTTATGQLRVATGVITNAQMLALRAAPKTLVAAPGAGFCLIFEGGYLTFDYTAAYTESADNMAVRFTDGSGQIVSGTIEATGFVDATADAIQPIVPLSPTTAPSVINAALVLHNTGDGEYGGGNAANAVNFTVYYRIVAVP